jgi:hypothetical protein
MFSSEHDALCSQLRDALVAAKAAVDGNASQVADLCDQVISHFTQNMPKESFQRGVGEACIASILKYDLIPLHMVYVDRGIKRGLPLHPGSSDLLSFGRLASYLSLATSGSSNASTSALTACLLKHDYISFLMSTYQVLMQKSGRKRTDVDWEAAASTFPLIQIILFAEETEYLQGQEQSSSKNRHGSKNHHPVLRSRKLEEFLLRHASVGLRQMLPLDQGPPGALATFSIESEGMLLGRDHLECSYCVLVNVQCLL